MVLATVDATGRPSARTVLLKGVDADGFRFFTNTASRKGSELAADPRCSLLFPWHPLERQVRVEGVAERLSRDEVEAYFARARGARSSVRGPATSPRSCPTATRWRRRTTRRRRASTASDVPVPDGVGRLPRAAPRSSSSGRADRAGCTTGWSTGAYGRRLDHGATRTLMDESRLSGRSAHP